MKDKLLTYFSKFKDVDKTRIAICISSCWKTMKKYISICYLKIKEMTLKEFIKSFLYLACAIVAICTIIYFYEVLIALGVIGLFLYVMYKEYEKDEKNKAQRLIDEKLLREEIERENEKKLTELKYRFNAPITNIVNYTINQYVLVSEEKTIIMINERIYAFSDIIEFSLSDNSIEVFSPMISKTKTDSGSMVGRAIVGGVLTGGVGAIIGGVSAKKTTETTGGTSHTEHNYTLIITVNNLSHPIEKIHIGENIDYANELCSIFVLILNRNQRCEKRI